MHRWSTPSRWLWLLFVLPSLPLAVAFLTCAPPQEKPLLDAILPNQGFSGTSLSLTLKGRHFFSGVEAFLRDSKGQRFALSEMDVRTPTEIRAQLPKSIPTGAYDLLLQLPDKTEIVLGAAFELLPNVLTIYVLDAGQGDATLIRMPTGETLLIDAGREEDVDLLREQLDAIGLSSVDYFLATHYDADHVGGVEKLFRGRDGQMKTADDFAPRKGLWDVGGTSKNRGYTVAREAYKDRHLPLDGSSKESFPSLRFGDVGFSVLATNGVLKKADDSLLPIACGSEENCRSIGTLITLGRFRFWTAGDLTGGGNQTPDAETALGDIVGKVDLYRAHHHGSKTSSNQALLQALQPKVVLISAGTQNSYCHPHAEVLERFVKLPDVWIFLTTAGIQQADSCGSTTQEGLAPLGSRALVKTGLIRILASPERYTLSLGLKAGSETFSFQPRP